MNLYLQLVLALLAINLMTTRVFSQNEQSSDVGKASLAPAAPPSIQKPGDLDPSTTTIACGLGRAIPEYKPVSMQGASSESSMQIGLSDLDSTLPNLSASNSPSDFQIPPITILMPVAALLLWIKRISLRTTKN